MSSLSAAHTDLPDQFMENDVVDVLLNLHQLKETLQLQEKSISFMKRLIVLLQQTLSVDHVFYKAGGDSQKN